MLFASASHLACFPMLHTYIIQVPIELSGETRHFIYILHLFFICRHSLSGELLVLFLLLIITLFKVNNIF